MTRATKVEHKVSKDEFDSVAEGLRTELLQLQDQLKSQDFPVVLLFAGAAVAGKTEALNTINEWMDPRWIETHAYGPPSDEERERPEYWRYWRDLPPRGRIGLTLGSWYHQGVQDFVYGRIGKPAYLQTLKRIAAFERTLTDDGVLLLKFWMHMNEADQKKRMKKLQKSKNEAWRISKSDWKHFKHNRAFTRANAIAIEKTNVDASPWVIVDGLDARYRTLEILSTIRDALKAHIRLRSNRRKLVEKARKQSDRVRDTELQATSAEENAPASSKNAQGARVGTTTTASRRGAARQRTILDKLDMSLSLTDKSYRAALQDSRAELGDLCRKLHFAGKSALVLFEGPDAAGKGGAIRRLTASMDARDYRVVPIAAPTDEERARHYLWRFWRQLPRAGRIAIFDRSWYGRVLVERVENFAQPEEWQRAFTEIREFEEQLAASGLVVVKFWVHIDKDEQYRRFKEREKSSLKSWKLTPEDWRNRAKWDEYGRAVHEMVERTSTSSCPWTIVEGNCKKHARIKVMETLCGALRKVLLTDGE